MVAQKQDHWRSSLAAGISLVLLPLTGSSENSSSWKRIDRNQSESEF